MNAPASPAAGTAPLSGVRVVDLGQFIAMPFCSLWLAWLGAEVIVVESRRHMTARTAPPFTPGREGEPNASGYYNILSSSKKSCTIDMTLPEGRALVQKLLGVCDVVVDNFSTGVMEKLGLGYDVVSRLNPGLVMASCGAFGRSGPLKNARGLHSVVNLYSGVADVTGYPGGAPRILGGVLPDPLGGNFALFAILAALHHRERTGQGQYIDIAMYEAMMALAPEAVIDLTLNDRDPARQGNRDRDKTPHGIYPCRNFDSWIALSVSGEDGWAAFCQASGNGHWRGEARFADHAARVRNVDALDEAVAAWTRTMGLDEAVERLQAAGIAAGPVLRSDELLDDPRLNERGMVVTTEHPHGGVRRQLGLPWRMDSLAADYRRAPLLGEHTREVVTGLLGLGEDEFRRLESDGVLS